MVFESKGLTLRYFGIKDLEDLGFVLVPIWENGMPLRSDLILSKRTENGFGRDRSGVSGDGDTSSLANLISIFARGGLVVCDGGTASL